MAKPPSSWFKVHGSAWYDGGISELDACERWLFFTGLKVASESSPRGQIQIPDSSLVSFANLSFGNCKVHPTADALAKIGIRKILAMGSWRRKGKTIEVVKWNEYQPSEKWGGSREGSGRPGMTDLARETKKRFPRATRIAEGMRSAGVGKIAG